MLWLLVTLTSDLLILKWSHEIQLQPATGVAYRILTFNCISFCFWVTCPMAHTDYQQ